MPAQKRSISAPQELFAKADLRQKALDYNKFSDYIQALIRDDVAGNRPHIRTPHATLQEPSSTSPAAAVLDDAVASAAAAASAPRAASPPVKYPAAVRSKRKPAKPTSR